MYILLGIPGRRSCTLAACYLLHLTVICTYRKGKQGKNKGEHTMNDKTREQIEAMKNQTIGV